MGDCSSKRIVQCRSGREIAAVADRVHLGRVIAVDRVEERQFHEPVKADLAAFFLNRFRKPAGHINEGIQRVEDRVTSFGAQSENRGRLRFVIVPSRPLSYGPSDLAL